MNADRTIILGHEAVLMKLDRMACEICEVHSETRHLVICGMNTRGFFVAAGLRERIVKLLPNMTIDLIQVDANAEKPVLMPEPDLLEADVIVVDDVINTGKTLMKVLNHIFTRNPNSISTAFLAKREHRNYPVKADYVGISLATTLQEHVVFDNSNAASLQVYLS